jgi:hypothetical protein
MHNNTKTNFEVILPQYRRLREINNEISHDKLECLLPLRQIFVQKLQRTGVELLDLAEITRNLEGNQGDSIKSV